MHALRTLVMENIYERTLALFSRVGSQLLSLRRIGVELAWLVELQATLCFMAKELL